MTSDQNKRILKALARQSIQYGIEHGEPLPVSDDYKTADLTIVRATFVTLMKDGQLRGCIGSLEARRPLVEDVVANSFASAFHDFRFRPVKQQELDELEISISILSPPQQIDFTSKNDLLQQLRPDIDGLIIQDGSYRATFLPSVWQSLPQPEQFLSELKRKAGLPDNYWSEDIQAYRYTTESF